jgi:hypothetical protein
VGHQATKRPVDARKANLFALLGEKSPPNVVLNDGTRKKLEDVIRRWWQGENKSWDAEVMESDEDENTDLWEGMPEMDSKAVARSSPLFEKELGIPLDIDLIRPGGYETVEEMIEDIVPKMLELANKPKQKSKAINEVQP